MALASCKTGGGRPALEGPINRAMPVWQQDTGMHWYVVRWRWDELMSRQKWSTTNDQAKQLTPVCVDLASYNRGLKYQKDLENYIEYLEKH